MRRTLRVAALTLLFLAASCAPEVKGRVGPPITASSCQPETCDTAP